MHKRCLTPLKAATGAIGGDSAAFSTITGLQTLALNKDNEENIAKIKDLIFNLRGGADDDGSVVITIKSITVTIIP